MLLAMLKSHHAHILGPIPFSIPTYNNLMQRILYQHQSFPENRSQTITLTENAPLSRMCKATEASALQRCARPTLKKPNERRQCGTAKHPHIPGHPHPLSPPNLGDLECLGPRRTHVTKFDPAAAQVRKTHNRYSRAPWFPWLHYGYKF